MLLLINALALNSMKYIDVRYKITKDLLPQSCVQLVLRLV